jgi:ATP/maltotriose-dependent transcriptional regulator MalT
MSCQDLHPLPDRPSPGFMRDARARYSPRHARNADEDTGTANSRERPLRIRPGRHASPAEPLTEREIQVLGLLRGSISTREIATELSLSPNTIKTHTRAIYRKLSVSTRGAAVTRGLDTGILHGRR